ncbi:hypothetical protein ACLB2K_004192 [Fragaria x ananassa]
MVAVQCFKGCGACYRADAECRVVNASQGPLMRSPLREIFTSRSTSSHASSSHATHVTVLICVNSSALLIILVLLYVKAFVQSGPTSSSRDNVGEVRPNVSRPSCLRGAHPDWAIDRRCRWIPSTTSWFPFYGHPSVTLSHRQR